jgi:hypothetical protein
VVKSLHTYSTIRLLYFAAPLHPFFDDSGILQKFNGYAAGDHPVCD